MTKQIILVTILGLLIKGMNAHNISAEINFTQKFESTANNQTIYEQNTKALLDLLPFVNLTKGASKMRFSGFW